MTDTKAVFDAEVAEAEERYCDAQVRGATYIDPAEYCEDEATHEGDDGGWYCDAHQADEPDPDRDRDDYRDWWDDSHLDDAGE
jgi:hypothetical protein